ncbi:hypothetical protein VD0004_g2638 [Verticillium dahliae]|uniref:Rhodopsin domain-containing protein n=1 Tax=Verticillium dahliae TaxID=27337 RepID=A0A444S729_VERDA|nr:hypothetical protein VD0004_g2638 [Verticillium dahliae]RXG49210.1 hypothetical protein VDGE_30414 [Verticillium dahliae]
MIYDGLTAVSYLVADRNTLHGSGEAVLFRKPKASDMTSTKSVYLERLARFAATQDLSQDKRSYVRDFSIACTALAAVFVALRFLARYRQRARLGADDWLALMAFVLLGGNLAINLVMVGQGLGLHAGVLTLEERQTMDKTMVAAEILYVTAVNVYKLSLLFLYIRIFPIHSVHLGGYICGGLSTAWNLTCAFTAAFQCSPREKLWEPWLEGRCINLFLAHLCIAVPSILLDIAILALPFPHVLPLNTTVGQKIMLMFVFLLGSYVVFTSIYRLRVFLLYSSDDISYTLASGCAWNVIEISAGAIAACVPTLVPLVRELVTLFTSVSSSFTGSSIMTVRDSGGNATTPLGRQKQPQVSIPRLGGDQLNPNFEVDHLVDVNPLNLNSTAP